MGLGAAGANLADRPWVARPQAGIAADSTAAARRLQAGLGPLGNQGALKLGDGAQHLQREHALGRCGVDRVAQAAKMRPGRFQPLDHGQQVADRAGEAIQPNHNQGLPAADVAQQACQHRPAAVSAGGVLFEDRRAACCAQFVELRIGALVFGGNARVADQTACCVGFLAVLPHLSAWLPF